MTNRIITETYDKEHFHFGGVICPSDFNNTYYGANGNCGSNIAQRIESDLRWEQSLVRQNQAKRDYYEKKAGVINDNKN